MSKFLAKLAARYLSRYAHKQRRYTVRERAKQIAREMGRPDLEARL